jgi:hypothetical protein
MVQFWIHCLLRANHTDGQYQGVSLKAGQFISGRIGLSRETGLSEQEIRTCISRLKSTNELTTLNMAKNTLFTINSWNLYQCEEVANQHINQLPTSFQPASNQLLTTNKNDKNENNVKNVKKLNTSCANEFERFWSAYPNKKKKPNALKALEKALEKTTIDVIMDALIDYTQSNDWLKDDGKYIPHPTTWLNGERWLDEIKPHEDKNSWEYLERELQKISTSNNNPQIGWLPNESN